VCVVVSRVHSIVRELHGNGSTPCWRGVSQRPDRDMAQRGDACLTDDLSGECPLATTHHHGRNGYSACRCKFERAAYCHIYRATCRCKRDVIRNEVKRDGGVCGK
jgi:hypothetical protein